MTFPGEEGIRVNLLVPQHLQVVLRRIGHDQFHVGIDRQDTFQADGIGLDVAPVGGQGHIRTKGFHQGFPAGAGGAVMAEFYHLRLIDHLGNRRLDIVDGIVGPSFVLDVAAGKVIEQAIRQADDAAEIVLGEGRAAGQDLVFVQVAIGKAFFGRGEEGGIHPVAGSRPNVSAGGQVHHLEVGVFFGMMLQDDLVVITHFQAFVDGPVGLVAPFRHPQVILVAGDAVFGEVVFRRTVVIGPAVDEGADG